MFAAAGNLESDPAACAAIYEELQKQYGDKLKVIQGEYNQSEIKYLIGRCDFFLGSRMHACIAALSQCIPTLGLAYSKKFYGVLGSIGAEKMVIDLRERDLDEVMRLVDSAYSVRGKSRTDLASRMPMVKQTVWDLFARVLPEDGSARHRYKA